MLRTEANSIFEQAAQAWVAEYPATATWLADLERHDVRVGVSSSSISNEVARVSGIGVPREADDIDLFVHNDDFMAAAALLPDATLNSDVSVRVATGDGLRLRMRADEVVGTLGDRPLQFMRPLTPLTYGVHHYRTAFSDQAADARTMIKTEHGYVPFAHPYDTIEAYARMQRRQQEGKHDLHHTSVLLRAYQLDDYAARRGAETGVDQRVWTYVRHAGSLSLQLAAGPARCWVP